MDEYMKSLNEYFQHTKFIEGNKTRIINYIKDQMYQHFIRVHYDVRNKEIIFMFTHIGNCNFKSLIRRECNGFILKCEERHIGSIKFTPIFRPMYSLANNFNGKYIGKELNENPQNYTIQPLYDGTVFGFYYMDGWNISSKNAISINENYTYMGYNLLSIVNDHINIESLDKKLTYSFVIIDNRLHPYQDEEDGKVYIMEAKDKNNDVVEINEYNYPPTLDLSLSDMKNNNAPDKYNSGNMGYIIRSNNKFINIAYKSALYKCLEKMLYDFKTMNIVSYENDWNDVAYYNFMKNNSVLPQLIPGMQDKYDYMNEQLNNIASYVKEDINHDIYPIEQIRAMLSRDLNINNTSEALLIKVMRTMTYHDILKSSIKYKS